MSKEVRQRKDDDQDNVSRALVLIDELMELNTQIEPNLWVSAFLSSVAQASMQNGLTKEEYLQIMGEAAVFYANIYEVDDER